MTDFATELQSAERAAALLRAKNDQIESAVSEAGRSAQLRTYRRQAVEAATEARRERDRLKTALDQLAATDSWSHDTLFEAFRALKLADKVCAAVAAHVGGLNDFDPMPTNRANYQMSRPAQCRELYQSLRWPDVLQTALDRQLAAEASTQGGRLRDEVHQAIAKAEAEARTEAEATDDGKIVVDREPSLIEMAREQVGDLSHLEPGMRQLAERLNMAAAAQTLADAGK